MRLSLFFERFAPLTLKQQGRLASGFKSRFFPSPEFPFLETLDTLGGKTPRDWAARPLAQLRVTHTHNPGTP